MMPHLMNCSHSPDGWCLSCVKQLVGELEVLRAWKESADAIENEWDCQAAAKMLGVPLGQSCRKGIAAKVSAVLAELAELRAACEPIRREVMNRPWIANLSEKSGLDDFNIGGSGLTNGELRRIVVLLPRKPESP